MENKAGVESTQVQKSLEMKACRASSRATCFSITMFNHGHREFFQCVITFLSIGAAANAWKSPSFTVSTNSMQFDCIMKLLHPICCTNLMPSFRAYVSAIWASKTCGKKQDDAAMNPPFESRILLEQPMVV